MERLRNSPKFRASPTLQSIIHLSISSTLHSHGIGTICNQRKHRNIFFWFRLVMHTSSSTKGNLKLKMEDVSKGPSYDSRTFQIYWYRITVTKNPFTKKITPWGTGITNIHFSDLWNWIQRRWSVEEIRLFTFSWHKRNRPNHIPKACGSFYDTAS